MSNQEPQYVDDRELARRTSIPRATWQDWRKVARGPRYLKIGRRVIYAWQDVLAWLDSHAVGQPPPA